MHVERVMHAIEVLVVVANGMNLGLGMTQFINRLHLTSDLCAFTAELTSQTGKGPMRLIFQRGNALNKEFERVDIACTG